MVNHKAFFTLFDVSEVDELAFFPCSVRTRLIFQVKETRVRLIEGVVADVGLGEELIPWFWVMPAS